MAALPGALALLLALAGALGLGLQWGGARGTQVVVDVSPSCDPPDPLPPGALLCRDSRLGSALREAAVNGVKRILLLTDGCDLSSGPPEPPGVPVDVTLLPRRDDLAVLRVRAPEKIPVGTDFAVEILVGRTAGPPRPVLTAPVTLFRDGERVGSPVAVRLERGATARLLVRDLVDRDAVVHYRAVLEDPVGPREDDAREAVVRIGERPLVLSIGGALELAGFDAREIAPAEAAAAPLDLADAIVVQQLPDAAAQARIADAVRAGAGLVLIGGRGVAGSPIEKVLPLTDAPPEGRATVLLLDVSGSMDELMPALADATEKLLRYASPDDRVALVFFRDRPVETIPWQRAADVRLDLRARRGTGNTLLLPAVEDAERLLRDVKGDRRLFVISDGKWGDLKDPRLREKLKSFGGMHRAALFVDDVPAEDWNGLFTFAVTAKDDLATALRKLEDRAHDRTVDGNAERIQPGPPWIAGVDLRQGITHRLVHLYPRGVGETVVLALAGEEIPVVAVWRPGGKVVMSASTDVRPPIGKDLAALVRAVLKDTGGIRLRAWRDGDGVVAEATGSDGAPFVFGEVAVAARPVGPDRWRATVLEARPPLEVKCGPATALVPLDDRELAGLSNRPDIAAAIAAASGGRVVEEKGVGEEEAAGPGAAVWATLIFAATLVLVSAWRRRRV